MTFGVQIRQGSQVPNMIIEPSTSNKGQWEIGGCNMLHRPEQSLSNRLLPLVEDRSNDQHNCQVANSLSLMPFLVIKRYKCHKDEIHNFLN